jgi:hypothetical protein
MKILKIIGKSLGGFFVLLGLTIFIMSLFGNNALNNFSVLENSVSTMLNFDVQQIEQYCNENPNDENCQNSLFMIKNEIDDFRYYGGAMKGIGIIFFIVGFLLLVWCSSLIDGLRQTSLISLIGAIFSYFYYKYAISGALNSFLPPEFLGVIGEWVQITLKQTLNSIMILGITFLILTGGLYILKYKKKLSASEK